MSSASVASAACNGLSAATDSTHPQKARPTPLRKTTPRCIRPPRSCRSPPIHLPETSRYSNSPRQGRQCFARNFRHALFMNAAQESTRLCVKKYTPMRDLALPRARAARAWAIAHQGEAMASGSEVRAALFLARRRLHGFRDRFCTASRVANVPKPLALAAPRASCL